MAIPEAGDRDGPFTARAIPGRASREGGAAGRSTETRRRKRSGSAGLAAFFATACAVTAFGLVACSGSDAARDRMIGRGVDELVREFGPGARFDASPLQSALERYGYVDGFGVVWFYADAATRRVTAWRRTRLLTGFPDADSLLGLGEREVVDRLGPPPFVMDEGGDRIFFYHVAVQDGPFAPFRLEPFARVVYFSGGRVTLVAPDR